MFPLVFDWLVSRNADTIASGDAIRSDEMADRTGKKRSRDAIISNRSSLARDVADRIRDEIIRRFKPGDSLPSERRLAEMLSVGRDTIRKALAELSNSGWLKTEPGHRRRVSRPRRRSVRTTGLFFPFDAGFLLTHPFYREVYTGLSIAAGKNGQHVLNFFGLRRRLREVQPSVFWLPNMRAVDSLITFEVFRTELIAQAAELYPVVCLDHDCRMPNVSSVAFDHSVTIRTAFKYLLDLGHRRISYVGHGGVGDPATEQRLNGFQHSIEQSGLAADLFSIWDVNASFDVEKAERFVGQWRAAPAHRRETALIVVDGFWPLMASFFSAGVRVPADLSIIDIGVARNWGEYLRRMWGRGAGWPLPKCIRDLHPPDTMRPAELAQQQPTLIALPARQMGRWGMDEVIRRLNDPASEPRHELLIPELVLGKTTAAPYHGAR